MAKPTAIEKLNREVEETPAQAAAREADELAKEEARLAGEASVDAKFKEATRLLAQARALKADDFTVQEEDFWKPTEPNQTVQGVYLGVVQDKYKTHCLGTVDKEGTPLMIRLNGTRKLNNAFSRCIPNKHIVRVKYLGKVKTDSGRSMNDYEIGTKLLKA